jgi:hypothetical protein
MELEFSQQIFEKCPNIYFHQDSSSRSRVVPHGRTDIHELKRVAYTSTLSIKQTALKQSACVEIIVFGAVKRAKYVACFESQQEISQI